MIVPAGLLLSSLIGRGVADAVLDEKLLTAARDAVTLQMNFYNENGLFDTTGWWNAANVFTMLGDYMLLTNTTDYLANLDNTIHLMSYEKNRWFRNEYYDDTLWWGLAFIKAFDLTGDSWYLELAIGCAEWVNDSWDEICGGGTYWRRPNVTKGAINNGLFLKLAASIGRRLPEGEDKFRWNRRAVRGWDWFKGADFWGAVGSEEANLIKNEIDATGNNPTCKGTGQVWTYNQGCIIGTLTELAKSFPENTTYIEEARKIHNALVKHPDMCPNGILADVGCHYTDPTFCGNDGPTFKGVYMRNIGELNRLIPDHPFTGWIQNQGESILANNVGPDGLFGLDWATLNPNGDSKFTAATHCAALEALVAGINADYPPTPTASPPSSSYAGRTIASLSLAVPGIVILLLSY